ncbi:F-box-like/WD repeat-containing protein TBL1X [Daphnia pulex]|uniref:F-box-like/WD repeat-containing protein TBL1X n=1 Tax=Daphnia pulex TaxID=6669 RepID=UPI001EE0D1EC|nr:F-box-like/WD repeat-containing protein TBL1X [Daphnia pulex]
MASENAYLHSKLVCFENDKKFPCTEITHSVFDNTGQRLACAFGDHRVLIFSENSNSNSPIQEWDTTTLTVYPQSLSSLLSSKAIILVLDWNAAGSLLAAGDFNGLFYIFSVSGGSLLSFTNVSNKITNIRWNRKGSQHLLLISGDDGAVEVWHLSEQTPLLVQKFSHHTSSVRDIQWLTKETFASCSLDGSIYVCRIGNEETLYSLFSEQAIMSIHYNVKHDALAYFSYDRNVKLWSLEKDCIREWEGHTRGIYAICWNESDDLLASGGDDKTVRIWNVNSSLCQSQKVLRQHDFLVTAVSFSPNGRYLASADVNGIVIVWTTEDWSTVVKHQCSGTILNRDSLQWNTKSTKLVVANQSNQLSTIEWKSSDDDDVTLL